MSDIAYTPISGVILAGGQSSRMGEAPKALADLKGKPMIRHVIDRLRPQVSSLMLSVEPGTDHLAQFDLPLVEDRVESHRGPLNGLFSTLHQLAIDRFRGWLLLAPCDAPFVPEDLSRRLLAAVLEEDVRVAAAEYQGVLQPTFSLWHPAMLDDVRGAVLDQGQGGIRQVLETWRHVAVPYADADIPPFFNVNSPEELTQAADWLEAEA